MAVVTAESVSLRRLQPPTPPDMWWWYMTRVCVPCAHAKGVRAKKKIVGVNDEHNLLYN